LAPSLIADLQKSLPELPDEKKARFVRDYALSGYDAGVLVAERETAEYFEAMVAAGADAKAAANWLINEYFGRLNKEGLTVATGPLSAQANAAILQMVAQQEISGKVAKDVLTIAWTEGGDRRTAWLEAGERCRRAGENRRRDRRQQSGQSGGCESQSEGDRLVRRPGDEGLRRQGQSADRERTSKETHRRVSGRARGRRSSNLCGEPAKFRRPFSLADAPRARAKRRLRGCGRAARAGAFANQLRPRFVRFASPDAPSTR